MTDTELQVQNSGLIVLEQLPVITARLKELEADIDGKLQLATSLAVTADSKQAAKTMKAGLNKEKGYYEDLRKTIRVAILKPYDAFCLEYDSVIKGKYDAAEKALNVKISAIEDAEIADKTETIKTYFTEYLQSKNIDWLTFEQSGIKVNLTATPTGLKKAAKEWIDRVADDLALIELQEHKAEILVEYKLYLNCSQAITTVLARHKAIADEQAKSEEQKRREAIFDAAVEKVQAATPPIAPPITQTYIADDDTVQTLAFRVTATRGKLKALKQFLNDGGYKCE